MDVFQIANILVEHVKEKFADDVALIAYYGSYATGHATARSDLDFFFIPATEKGYEAGLTFIVDGIGFDFWPISWERAERMASFEEYRPTILANSKVLYVRSGEDAKRYSELQDRIARMTAPGNRKPLLERALTELKEGYVHLAMMNRPDSREQLTLVRTEACLLVTAVLQSLGFANETYFVRGWGQNWEQVRRLPVLPDALEALIGTIMAERDCGRISAACEELIERTRSLLVAQQRTVAEARSLSEVFHGYYEEAKGTINKLIVACEQGDRHTAFFAAVSFQDELIQFFRLAEEGIWHSELSARLDHGPMFERLGLPDLVSAYDANDLNGLREATFKLDQRIRELLQTHGVKLNEFATVDEFRSFIESRL